MFISENNAFPNKSYVSTDARMEDRRYVFHVMCFMDTLGVCIDLMHRGYIPSHCSVPASDSYRQTGRPI